MNDHRSDEEDDQGRIDRATSRDFRKAGVIRRRSAGTTMFKRAP